MTHVEVEIKKAGDGVNYPKKGRTVTIHYAGVSNFLVSFTYSSSFYLLSVSNPFIVVKQSS